MSKSCSLIWMDIHGIFPKVSTLSVVFLNFYLRSMLIGKSKMAGCYQAVEPNLPEWTDS